MPFGLHINFLHLHYGYKADIGSGSIKWEPSTGMLAFSNLKVW